MASPILPHSPATGLPIALLVCIVAAVAIFVVLMVIAFRFYLVRRRRHSKLRDRAPRSAIYFAPTNPKFKTPLLPHEHPFPPLHPRNLAAPVLPQLRFHSPITPSRPSLPVQSNHDTVLPPLPLRFSGTDREQKHLVVPVSSYSQHRDRWTRVPLNRMNSDITTTTTENSHYHHRPGEGENDDNGNGWKRKRREVVNEYFADAVNQRSGEPHVPFGEWDDHTRIKILLLSEASSVSLAPTRNSTLLDDDDDDDPHGKFSPPSGRGRIHGDPWHSREDARPARLSASGSGSSKPSQSRFGLEGEWTRHGFVPAPLAVARKSRGWV